MVRHCVDPSATLNGPAYGHKESAPRRRATAVAGTPVPLTRRGHRCQERRSRRSAAGALRAERTAPGPGRGFAVLGRVCLRRRRASTTQRSGGNGGAAGNSSRSVAYLRVPPLERRAELQRAPRCPSSSLIGQLKKRQGGSDGVAGEGERTAKDAGAS